MGMSSETRNKPLVNPTGEEAFEAVFTRYYPLVYRLAFRCTGQRDEADDIAARIACAITIHHPTPQAKEKGGPGSAASPRIWV
jgi:hypothetical protein